ncbi:MAG: protein kinase [Pseudonocardia sp.]|nr:protein kinase [Pseudonocardia sp.]
MSTPGDEEQRLIGGRYRLSSKLGSGAMGTVWSGYDEVLRRRVAVKELKVPPGIPQGEALAMRERMLREARALGGLSHPNVITVFDVVDVEGQPMVVLEMVPSRNLAMLITEQGRLSPVQAGVVGFATGAALRAAHRAGITHRDVKPGNVLVGHDGRIKLTDFGIARNIADAPMTTAGLVLGSPAYIAPEVAAGQAVTPAADLWGLGATLFAAIEGRPPYDVHGDPVSTITEVVDGEVPRPSGSGPITEVIAALMVKEPEHRMPLDEVRRRLRPLLADPDDPLYPGSPDAPTVAALITRPGDRVPAPRSSSSGAVTEHPGERSQRAGSVGSRPAPLAPSPGPLPTGLAGGPVGAGPTGTGPTGTSQRATAVVPAGTSVGMPHATTPRAARSRTQPMPGWLSAVLALAGAALVIAGAVGGYAVTRTIAGQPPLSTVSVTTADSPTVTHTDPLGFSLDVPADWAQYRFEPGAGTGEVRFVSPDGTEELGVHHARAAAEITDALTAEGLGVDAVDDGQATGVRTAANAEQRFYRTRSGDQQRANLVRIIPDATGVWALTLSVPDGRQGDRASELMDALSAGFTATGGGT